MIKTGIIGINSDNGHPYSFSSIINGYDDQGYLDSDWPVIHDYLKKRKINEIGFSHAQVTHIWTQDRNLSENIAKASLIPNIASTPGDMLADIDALIIARHDYDTHLEHASKFLESGIPVFVDKPLSLISSDLEYFKPFIDKGLLMSCSALRYSPGLLELKQNLNTLGSIKYINATVCLDWVKYGIHMLDCLLALDLGDPISIRNCSKKSDSFLIELSSGIEVSLFCLGNVGPTFEMTVIGDSGKKSIGMYDNFSAFKNCLKVFFEMCDTRLAPIDSHTTLIAMQTLKKGLEAKKFPGKELKI